MAETATGLARPPSEKELRFASIDRPLPIARDSRHAAKARSRGRHAFRRPAWPKADGGANKVDEARRQIVGEGGAEPWFQARTGDAARREPLDSTVTFTLARTVSGGTHRRIVHGGFARTAVPAVAMAGAGCRLSLGLIGAGKPVGANTPRLLLLAA